MRVTDIGPPGEQRKHCLTKRWARHPRRGARKPACIPAWPRTLVANGPRGGNALAARTNKKSGRP
eukprot:1720346-Lingulodinium_polyedra.AAC.1